MHTDPRISNGIQRGKQIEMEVDGERVLACEGESIASALIASGKRTFRHTAKHDAPRGIFCGMGVCFDCVMTVNGVPNVRTCVTRAEPGMKVTTQRESLYRGGR